MLRSLTRRIAAPAALGLATLVTFVPGAAAQFSSQKVNEVMLSSSSGGTSVQFVELFDAGGSSETFPALFGPYKLVTYDAGAERLGGHTLNANGMATASAAGRPYLISTAAADAAFGVHGDETLDVPLISPGQACFTVGSSETPYSCIAWGCVTHYVLATSGTGTAMGAPPPSDQSAQRQPDDSVQIAAPTPGAKNRSGSADPVCPNGAGGTGGGGGGGSTPPGNSFGGVRVSGHKLRLGRGGVLALKLACPAGSGGCAGRITLSANLPHRGRRRIARRSFSLGAGATRKLRMKLSQAARLQLARHRRLTVHVKVDAHDGAGVDKVTTMTVVVRA